MSANSEKSREQILAERQEKKKKKAALKNQLKDKIQNSGNENSVKVTSSNVKSAPLLPKQNVEIKSVPLESLKNKLLDQNLKCKESSSDSQTKLPSNFNSNSEKKIIVNCEVEKYVPLTPSDIKETVINKKDENLKKQKPNFKKSDIEIGNNKEDVKSKAQLRAERRAKQEAERARKLEKTQTSSQEKKIEKPAGKPIQQVKVSSTVPVSSEASHKVKLFAHLYSASANTDEIDSSEKIHPCIIQLETQYSSKVVNGANACCLALLNALKKVVMDFETPHNQEFSRGLEAEISRCMSFLSKSRPIAVSMSNAVKHLKFQITQTKGNELEIKNNINEWIDTYIREQLEMAAKAICLFVREKITSGDVILTYGCSSLIQQILLSVHNEGINFQVIVVDGRPWLEGKEMLKQLVNAGIHCTYVFVNGLSFIMPEVTKILLGAHALLANGYVMSQAGSSQIALLAKAYNVPVLVCCETHKFSERVQTDSFVHNELGNPDELVSNKGCISNELSKWKSIPYLTPLNLTYDVTPPDLVSAVVTEIAVLPCTSVPVILRIKPPDVSY